MEPPKDLPKMQYRRLGRSGLYVSAISLGGWLTYGQSGGGHVTDTASFACMKAAYDAGINFFDCAEGYAGGESERVMGACIKHYGWKRNDYVVSTKINWGAANGDNPVNNQGLSRKHLVEGTRASLERLGLEYVDLLYAHRPDRETPMEEIVRGFNFLIDRGLCFYWGTSEWSADEIERAQHVATRLGMVGPLMEQPQYNMLWRDKVEVEYSLLYEEYGMGLTPFSPLKAGILTGKYNDGIPKDSRFAVSDDGFVKMMQERFQTKEWEEEAKKVATLKPVADKLGTSQARLAMAWVLKNPNVSSAITGASRVEQVWDSIRALELLPKLTPEIMEEIDGVLKNKPTPLTRRFK
jgi:voltage-dependent potassium channel beta subunit